MNLSSRRGPTRIAGQYVDYAAAKGAIDTFTHGTGARGRRRRHPRQRGAARPIDTEIHASGGEPDRAKRWRRRCRCSARAARGGGRRPILWLLSDAASYTTGSLLDVTAGR